MTPGNGPNDWRQMRDQRRMQHRMMHAQWRAQRAAWRSQHPSHGHIVAGVILLIVGVAFLLANLGLFYVEDVRKYWPVLLIVWGMGQALVHGGSFGGGFGPRFGAHRFLWSGMWIVMGGLLLAQNFGYARGDVWEVIWPVILIFLGISFLFRRAFWNGIPPGVPGISGGPEYTGPSSPGSGVNSLDETTVFGGINRRIDSQDFEGGHLSSVFGGIEIDLRKANTKRDEIVIEADAVFGGIELMVPEQWRVTVKGAGVFGGYEDQTHPSPTTAADEKRPHLIVTGSAVFGGVSVRN
jgi:hypothetical protein